MKENKRLIIAIIITCIVTLLLVSGWSVLTKTGTASLSDTDTGFLNWVSETTSSIKDFNGDIQLHIDTKDYNGTASHSLSYCDRVDEYKTALAKWDVSKDTLFVKKMMGLYLDNTKNTYYYMYRGFSLLNDSFVSSALSFQAVATWDMECINLYVETNLGGWIQ